ncbi:MAG: rRNA adenine methyltransferase [Bacteroidia bacterium]
MQFDPENKIVKLCAEGMEMEGLNKMQEAEKLFQQAWDSAENEMEKFIAAHYLARRQKNINDKLKWDETALDCALKINGEDITGAFPSLYLNIAKGHEDLGNFEKAKLFYNEANSFVELLPDDGYGKLLKSGITKGLERIETKIKGS